ncbi:MAG: CDP-diacylglycerol--glycerol-3-phosphate 3-phosphatidyltransferase [Planctomycetales bacterium]|nr:CDP-diacylglycerol--glycerol-3-phosphate 3-phosphatidyltransferase [Planctomycetales bacterium]
MPEPRRSNAPLTLGSALNLPNLITLSRLVLSLVLFTMMSLTDWWLASAILFVVAASTDFLDGYIARKYGLVTVLGRIMDPFVDKVIVCGAFVFLLPLPASGVTAWMAILVIGREMLVTSLRSFLEQMGKDFSASWSGKVKMGLQCVAVTASLLSMSPTVRDHQTLNAIVGLRNILLWSAVAATVYSGFIYVQRAVVLVREASRSE